MLCNAHLCNHILLQSGGGTWAQLCTLLRGVGSESRDVDAWAQTSLYAEDRGPCLGPMTLEHSPVRQSRTGPDPQAEDSDRHVSAYPIGPH
jgi:hypothetical protein